MKLKQISHPYLTWAFIALTIVALTTSSYVSHRTRSQSLNTLSASICPPRKIYIDGGANLANTLFMFDQALGKPPPNALPYWEIYSFEASEELTAYTQIVVDGLNGGLSLDDARKHIHWNDTVHECVMKCYTENQPYIACDALITDWHNRFIQPLIDSNDRIGTNLTVIDNRCGRGPTKRNTFRVMNAAMCDASTKDLQFSFSFSNYVNGGSNGMNLETHAGGTMRSYSVPCISIAQWVMNNFDKKDYIVLKLDIEGAEYMVMNDLLFSGALQYIDEIFVEWHSRFASVQQYAEFENMMKWIAESHSIVWHSHY